MMLSLTEMLLLLFVEFLSIPDCLELQVDYNKMSKSQYQISEQQKILKIQAAPSSFTLELDNILSIGSIQSSMNFILSNYNNQNNQKNIEQFNKSHVWQESHDLNAENNCLQCNCCWHFGSFKCCWFLNTYCIPFIRSIRFKKSIFLIICEI